VPRPGTTTQRGYGAAHAARARELKAAMRDGQPCGRGGEPMYRWQLDLPRGHPRSIHADHLGTPRALGGDLPDALTCAHHNQQHGARLGNRLRGAARRGRSPGAPRGRGRTSGPLPAW
jgi:hypothetical protein